MTDRARPTYPGYDVMSKRDGLSWNDATRRVIDHRLSVPQAPSYFGAAQWATLVALCARILPQPQDRAAVPLAALLDRQMLESGDAGFRRADMPYAGEAWRRGLDAIASVSLAEHGASFDALEAAAQDALIRRLQQGRFEHPALGAMPAQEFFGQRVMTDIPAIYYAHPASWNEIGFGGPASPRGYVRMAVDRRDGWEAAEAKPGREASARRENTRVR